MVSPTVTSGNGLCPTFSDSCIGTVGKLYSLTSCILPGVARTYFLASARCGARCSHTCVSALVRGLYTLKYGDIMLANISCRGNGANIIIFRGGRCGCCRRRFLPGDYRNANSVCTSTFANTLIHNGSTFRTTGVTTVCAIRYVGSATGRRGR